ncbi:TonB-dependent receptor [Sphingomonas sp. CGMCC 1.13654]|uniref:TonB-dependent receptor n=1 Tax=Sphingomonas chungangi TaxID=2683589 RepID=A0A838L1Z1_9SPHN|nr:TonB-dependent receptor [Sphingomonas chungangi]MBA2933513.1 TonB-dependent receptor [Sphingomonas chungangi]MVW54846.1 TonB-dependent receptor plug domain-containing protein [Sphingomonas chungangi]
MRIITWLGSTAALGLLAGQASAQASTDASAATAAAPNAAGLGEIVVTAQHRSENVQRAAIAIDVVGGKDLIKDGITEPGKLGQKVPALSVQATGGGNLFFIRGVGNFSVAAYSDPAIAFNYDGVYVSRPTSTNGTFFDLDRVEVLKGPQGTLYGRNATGGAINVLPAQPRLGELSGYATVSYGNYDAVSAEGAINLPMGDKGALRISGNIVEHDGYLKDGTSDEDTKALRVQMKSELTPTLTVRLAADYSHLGGAGYGESYLGSEIYNPALKQYVFTPTTVPLSDGIRSDLANAYRTTLPAGSAGRTLSPIAAPYFPNQYRADNFYGFNAQIDWDSAIGKFTLIPAWRAAQISQVVGGPGFPPYLREKDNQYSLEARLAGKRIGIFDWQIGGFAYDESDRAHYSVNQSSVEIYQDFAPITHSYAGFGRLTAHLTNKLRIVGGIRYTSDHRTFTGTQDALVIACTHVVAGRPSCPTAPLFDTSSSLATQILPVPPRGGALPLGATGAVIRHQGFDIASHLNNNRATWRAAVEYDLAPQSLFYASYETGYRSGGFSLAVGESDYQPEYITAYTIGLKNRLLDNRLQLNLEGFIWRYRNQQVLHPGTDLAGNQVNFTQNIGRSNLKGVEMDARALVTPTTALNADVQYLHARYSSFSYQVPTGTAPPATGCPYAINPANAGQYTVNCSGLPAYNSPKWTINLGAEQTIRIGEGKIVLSADTQYRSSNYVGFEYLPIERVPARWLSDAQISYSPPGGKWTIAAFVHNIEDHRTVTYVNYLSGVVSAYTSAPRTFGGRASITF